MMMQKIKSFEHACEVLGISADVSKFQELDIPAKDIQPLINQYKLHKIIEANNKLNNWECDWGNSRQWKYTPWFDVNKDASKPAGFGFSYCGYDRWHTFTNVGSRLLVGSSDEAEYIGTDFIELYESAFLIIKEK